jgi:hypothetical protein
VFCNGTAIKAVGLSGQRDSLIYVVASGASYPTGATNVSLPLQQGQTVTVTNWPAGTYCALWYDPSTSSLVGSSQAVAASNSLTLPLPNFSVDLVGIVYPPPTLTARSLGQNGNFQFQFNSELGGVYVIESSTNLVNWTSFQTVTNIQGSLVVTGSMPATNSLLFFRAHQ